MASDEPLPEPDVKDIDGTGAPLVPGCLKYFLMHLRLFVAYLFFCDFVDLTFDLNGFFKKKDQSVEVRLSLDSMVSSASRLYVLYKIDMT